ncbi:beta-lactamase-like protein [Elsinoe ampelina]|uniref:Beta-lactamase-like protein n=1 Tax=Elsinoe ampelina TaxID=302913 RepID=A0A6A6GHB1_9PEZI|nr:beta-lactamase-like protein [Elsinoe ampelina]
MCFYAMQVVTCTLATVDSKCSRSHISFVTSVHRLHIDIKVIATITNMSPLLPPPRENQTYVSVSALIGGHITLADHFFVYPSEPGASRTVPSLVFLVTHPNPPENGVFGKKSKPYRLLFDLGLRKAAERYKPVMQQHLQNRRPYKLGPGIREQLEEHNLPADSIDAVMLSHVHYDHHGDPCDFPTSTFIIGHGAMSVLKDGLSGAASHQHFESDLLDAHKVIELPSPSTSPATPQWAPLGPFPSALDLFSDSSVYILDVPGHLPGHLNLLCRISPTKWLCLCGDAFHDPRLLTGEKGIGTWEDGGVVHCIHVDKATAEESIGRLRELRRAGGEGVEVELVAAHDEVWTAGKERGSGGGLWPGVLE